MELVSFAKEMLQSVAEQAVSYRFGQAVLRQIDRALWVVEKCARWAVPPPLDQDDRPQQELVRPLPWVFFLALLLTLRLTRESISLINLALGKPPLRSADVVMYIQSKRRYLRTLKYQGNRIMRARTGNGQPVAAEPWYSRLHSLFQFTMCFRRHSHNYGNNNTTQITNNDEILVVKRRKILRQNEDSVPSTSETTMERFIEKMVDLNADSDEDSSFTLTNAPSIGSECETSVESDQESENLYKTSATIYHDAPTSISVDDMNTPSEIPTIQNELSKDLSTRVVQSDTPTPVSTDDMSSPEKDLNSSYVNSSPSKSDVNSSDEKFETPQLNSTVEIKENLTVEEAALSRPDTPKVRSFKEETENMLQSEKCSPQNAHQSPKKEKIANGRTIKTVPSKKKDLMERRDSDVPVVKITPADESCDKEEDSWQSHQNEQ